MPGVTKIENWMLIAFYVQNWFFSCDVTFFHLWTNQKSIGSLHKAVLLIYGWHISIIMAMIENKNTATSL